jgi:hypothetical protein
MYSAIAASSKSADITQNMVGILVTRYKKRRQVLKTLFDGFFAYFTEFDALKKKMKN